MLPPPPVGFSNPRHSAEVRHHFSEVGFDAQSTVALTHRYTRDILEPRTRAAMLHVTNSTQPLAILQRLFILGEPVPRSLVDGALGPQELPSWIAAGFLEETAEELVGARVAIWPFARLWVVTDRDPRESEDRSVVMGLTGSTETLARIAIRGDDVERACDLGTGSGILALLLARHSKRVIATDIEPRAIAFAELNAAFNDVDNIEFRLGDGAAPVAGETFERIVFNPPYVLSPDPKFAYRDGGTDFLPRVLGDLPALLSPGGFAQLLGQWPIGADGSPATLFRWLEESNVDAEALLGRVVPAAAYATQWCGGPDAPKEIPRWLEAFEKEGIERIAEGLVTLYRPEVEGPPVRTLEPAPPRLDEKSPQQIERRFRQLDFLRGHQGSALEQATLRVSKGVRIVQETEAREDGWAAPRLRLLKTTDLPRDREIDGATLSLVTSLDGTRCLESIVAELESETAGEETPDWLELARELLREGYLGLSSA